MATDPTRIGSIRLLPRDVEEIEDGDTTIVNKLDFTAEYTAHLSDAVGQDFFDKILAGDPAFDSNEEFAAYFNGIALTDISTNAMFRISSVTIKLHYSYDDDGTTKDESYIMSYGPFQFHSLDSDKTGTPLDGLMANSQEFEPSNDFRYMQSGTDIMIKADFSEFMSFADTIPHIVINKAQVITGQINTPEEYLDPAGTVFAFFTDNSNSWPIEEDNGYNALQIESP